MVLGAAFGMGVPMAYAAETNAVPPEAWLLFIANWFWCVAYDTLYAMADRQDDLKLGLRSSAILFGELDRVAVAMLQAAFVFSLVLIGRKLELQWPFWLALGVAVLLLARQLWLIRARDPIMSLKAFRENNGVGLVLTLGIWLVYNPREHYETTQFVVPFHRRRCGRCDWLRPERRATSRCRRERAGTQLENGHLLAD